MGRKRIKRKVFVGAPSIFLEGVACASLQTKPRQASHGGGKACRGRYLRPWQSAAQILCRSSGGRLIFFTHPTMLCPRLEGVLGEVQPCAADQCAKAARRPLRVVDPLLSGSFKDRLRSFKMEAALLLTLRVLPTCRATCTSTFQLWRRACAMAPTTQPLLQHDQCVLTLPCMSPKPFPIMLILTRVRACRFHARCRIDLFGRAISFHARYGRTYGEIAVSVCTLAVSARRTEGRSEQRASDLTLAVCV